MCALETAVGWKLSFFFENNPESETLVRLVRVRFIKVYKRFRCAELTLFGQLFLCLVCSQMINIIICKKKIFYLNNALNKSVFSTQQISQVIFLIVVTVCLDAYQLKPRWAQAGHDALLFPLNTQQHTHDICIKQNTGQHSRECKAANLTRTQQWIPLLGVTACS